MKASPDAFDRDPPDDRPVETRLPDWTASCNAEEKAERYEFLLRYVGRDPSQAVFAQGWANRLNQFEKRF
jgi:hypothetical protein